MSKFISLDLENFSVGQFDAIPPALTWSLNGHPSVSGGGSTQLTIPNEVAVQQWLNFGRMVVCKPDADLDFYVGMIDTPWSAISPVKLTVYDGEYLFNVRVDENQPRVLKGSIPAIVQQFIDLANAEEDLFIRLGTVQEVNTNPEEEPLDGRPLWDQFRKFLLRTGTEMKFRPEKGADNRWYIYIDIAKSMGMDTDFELSDGKRGNMKIRSATVRGEIINRKIGIGSQSSPESRLQTEPIEDVSSRAAYRMRNRFVQFQDVEDKGVLKTNTTSSVAITSYPYLELVVEVLNINHAFQYLRPGNRLIAHPSRIYLPAGVRGWRGRAQITRMAYLGVTKTVNMTLIGAL